MAVIEAAVPQAEESGAGQTARPRVLHSHHYHAQLQRVLADIDKVDGQGLLGRAAAEAAYQHLCELPGWGDRSAAARREAVAELFRASGLGRLDAEGVGADGGEAVVTGSFFARGTAGRTPKPGTRTCGSAAGLLAGALSAVYGRAYEVTETSCVGAGDRACRFQVVAGPGAPTLLDEVVYPVPAGEPAPTVKALLEGDELESVLFDAPLIADGDGRIRALGEELAFFWGDYYNRVCYRFEREIPRVMGAKFGNLGSIVLTEAGHLYAYHALGGILNSPEWHLRVAPRLRDREHWVLAITALVNALGWGSWRIQSLVPGERLTLRVHDSYEGTGYRRLFGRTSAPKCYLSRGTAAAIMNLLYVGDITTRPELSMSYYNQLFRSPISFRALETRCRAMDDSVCEFVVNPLSPSLSARVRELAENRQGR